MTTMETRIAKLPCWARERIAGLEHQLAAAKLDIAQQDGTAETDTWLERRHQQPGRPLPKGASVRFGPDHHWISARRRGDRVEIYSARRLVIHCDSGSSLELEDKAPPDFRSPKETAP